MLYEILKTSKLGASFAPDMYTALWAQKLARDGEVKTLSGAPPLSFKANGQPLFDYLISGNTVQSTTPTPDNPIMPQGTGERTGNLLQIPDVAETTRNGVTYHVRGNSLYINGTSTSAFGFNIRGAFTLKAGTYTNQMYGFKRNRVYYSFNNVNTTMCTSDVNLYNTFTISEDTTYANALVWINSGVVFDNEKIDFALFESEVPKDFEPYGYNIPISSAGQTTPVYLGEVETTRRVKKLELTGEENWGKDSNKDNIDDYFYTDIILDMSPSITPISSHFVSGKKDVVDSVWATGTTANPRVVLEISKSYTGITSADDKNARLAKFKSCLAQQYANGTPVTVWYVLANEETAVVNEPLMKIGEYADTLSYEQAGVQIPTARGTNTLNVLTDVKPSNVYLKYKEV